MKTPSTLLTLVVTGLLAVLAVGAWWPQAGVSAQAPLSAMNPSSVPAVGDASCATGRSVQVSGAAVINVIPDRALLQLGVQSIGVSPEAVQNANFQDIQRVVNAVRALGVDAKDIATDYFIVYPVYEDYNALSIKGYRVDNTVSITLRDIKLVDKAILAAFKNGANQVQDIQFYTSNLRQYRDQARSLAVKAANEKAQALASAAGAEAGCVLSINENTWSQYYGSWRGGRATALWAQNTIQNASPDQDQPSQLDDSPVSLGQIAVRAEVNASYSLK